jgi:hypothetical protein
MTVGKTLWFIIVIKLIIMFLILKPFFFQNYLKSNFKTEEERINYVTKELTVPAEQQNQVEKNKIIQ